MMKAALEPPRPSVRELVLVLHDAAHSESRWTARQARKPGPAGGPAAMHCVAAAMREREHAMWPGAGARAQRLSVRTRSSF